eukprot:ANDGO_04935.mRNA.1 Putative ankyrin repeat protein RF_0381
MERLLEAISRDDARAVQSILSASSSVALPDHRSPFLHACASGAIACATLFIERLGLRSTHRDKSGRSGIHLAAINGHPAMVSYLIRCRAFHPDVFSTSGYTALMEAVRANQISVVETLLSYAGDGGLNVNVRRGKQQEGATALHFAVRSDHRTRIMELLLTAGANVHIAAGSNAWTPAHELMGAKHQDEDMLRLLMLHDVSVLEDKDVRGRTPVHVAAAAGNSAFLSIAVAVLRKQPPKSAGVVIGLTRAPVDDTDGQGRSALHLAAEAGSASCIRLLIAAGANVHAQDHSGMRPVHCAASCREQDAGDCVKILMAYERQAQDRSGSQAGSVSNRGLSSAASFISANDGDIGPLGSAALTPLHVAVISGSEHAVASLVETCRADTICRVYGDDYCATPLHLACLSPSVSILQLLLRNSSASPINHSQREHQQQQQFSVELLVPDSLGRSPLFAAVIADRVDVARVLLEYVDFQWTPKLLLDYRKERFGANEKADLSSSTNSFAVSGTGDRVRLNATTGAFRISRFFSFKDGQGRNVFMAAQSLAMLDLLVSFLGRVSVAEVAAIAESVDFDGLGVLHYFASRGWGDGIRYWIEWCSGKRVSALVGSVSILHLACELAEPFALRSLAPVLSMQYLSDHGFPRKCSESCASALISLFPFLTTRRDTVTQAILGKSSCGTIRILLESNCPVDQESLIEAIKSGDETLVKLVISELNRQSSLNAKVASNAARPSSLLSSCVFYAFQFSQFQMIPIILGNSKPEVDRFGRDVLHYALFFGAPAELVHDLIRHHDITLRLSHVAALVLGGCGTAEVLRFLVRSVANNREYWLTARMLGSLMGQAWVLKTAQEDGISLESDQESVSIPATVLDGDFIPHDFDSKSSISGDSGNLVTSLVHLDSLCGISSEIDVIDSHGNTPGHYAAVMGHVNAIKDPHTLNQNGISPSMILLAQNMIPAFLERSCPAELAFYSMTIGSPFIPRQFTHLTDFRGRSLLHYAVAFNRMDMVRFIVDRAPELLNVPDGDDWLPSHYACSKECVALLSAVLEKAGTLVEKTPKRPSEDMDNRPGILIAASCASQEPGLLRQLISSRLIHPWEYVLWICSMRDPNAEDDDLVQYELEKDVDMDGTCLAIPVYFDSPNLFQLVLERSRKLPLSALFRVSYIPDETSSIMEILTRVDVSYLDMFVNELLLRAQSIKNSLGAAKCRRFLNLLYSKISPFLAPACSRRQELESVMEKLVELLKVSADVSLRQSSSDFVAVMKRAGSWHQSLRSTGSSTSTASPTSKSRNSLDTSLDAKLDALDVLLLSAAQPISDAVVIEEGLDSIDDEVHADACLSVWGKSILDVPARRRVAVLAASRARLSECAALIFEDDGTMIHGAPLSDIFSRIACTDYEAGEHVTKFVGQCLPFVSWSAFIQPCLISAYLGYAQTLRGFLTALGPNSAILVAEGKDEDGRSLAHWAASVQVIDTICDFVDPSFVPDVLSSVDTNGMGVIHFSALLGRVDVAKNLLSRHVDDVDGRGIAIGDYVSSQKALRDMWGSASP